MLHPQVCMQLTKTAKAKVAALLHLSLQEQLMFLNIERVYFRPLLVAGMISKALDRYVILFDNESFYKDRATLDKSPFTFAHELGHASWMKEYPQASAEKPEIIVASSEHYADAFAEDWLTQEENLTRVRRFIERYATSEASMLVASVIDF